MTKFEWTARVERSSGIWFDLHLDTKAYNAEDPKRSSVVVNEEDDDEDSDWDSRDVWNIYGSCTLSSTQWPGSGIGFLAGSKSEQFDVARIGKRTFAFDENPPDLDPPRPC